MCVRGKFCIVQADGIHLAPLIFLSKEEFKFLRVNFLKRVDRFFRKSPKRQSLFKKQPLACTKNKALSSRIDNYMPCYEPTNIVTTHSYLFWSFRRVKEYYETS
ncbi:MAG: hypothetical protein NC817_02170 [Candidatus Omnitrophica bacterium]|nr:hypothetical protein [Candidatus Omnitrophota bacterium]